MKIHNIFYSIISMMTLLLSMNVKAQQKSESLVNTQWKGIANVPTPEEVIFQFTSKDFNVLYQGQVIEQMTYGVDNNTLTLVKVSGGSPCKNESKGVYTFTAIDKKLNLTHVSDDCDERKDALKIKDFVKL